MKQHDCYGVIVRSRRRGVYEFLCIECGRPFMTLSKDGLRVESKHGSEKDVNVASLKALKFLIKEVEAGN